MVPFELIFILLLGLDESVFVVVVVFVFVYRSPIIWHYMLKKLSFLYQLLAPSLKISCLHILYVWDYFWTLHSVPFTYLSLHQLSHTLDYCSLIIKLGSASLPILFFFKVVLAILDFCISIWILE